MLETSIGEEAIDWLCTWHALTGAPVRPSQKSDPSLVVCCAGLAMLLACDILVEVTETVAVDATDSPSGRGDIPCAQIGA